MRPSAGPLNDADEYHGMTDPGDWPYDAAAVEARLPNPLRGAVSAFVHAGDRSAKRILPEGHRRAVLHPGDDERAG